MLKALRFFGWPLLAGVLIAMLIIQRFPNGWAYRALM